VALPLRALHVSSVPHEHARHSFAVDEKDARDLVRVILEERGASVRTAA
jgi:hypothetical protein